MTCIPSSTRCRKDGGGPDCSSLVNGAVGQSTAEHERAVKARVCGDFHGHLSIISQRLRGGLVHAGIGIQLQHGLIGVDVVGWMEVLDDDLSILLPEAEVAAASGRDGNDLIGGDASHSRNVTSNEEFATGRRVCKPDPVLGQEPVRKQGDIEGTERLQRRWCDDTLTSTCIDNGAPGRSLSAYPKVYTIEMGIATIPSDICSYSPHSPYDIVIATRGQFTACFGASGQVERLQQR